MIEFQQQPWEENIKMTKFIVIVLLIVAAIQIIKIKSVDSAFWRA